MQNLDFSKRLLERLQPSLPTDAIGARVQDIRALKSQGKSSILFSFVLTYVLNGLKQRKKLVLKIYNKNSLSNARNEFEMLKTLKRYNIAVPTAYSLGENDEIFGSCLLMEWVRGESVLQDLKDREKALITVGKTAELLGRVHKLNPSCVHNSKLLQEQYQVQQRKLLGIISFTRKTYRRHFSFSSPQQKRIAEAFARLRIAEPEKSRLTVLHMDYKPNHILASDRGFVIIDWGIASVGDPSYDVAYMYHRLRSRRWIDKIDLEEHFVKTYENFMGQKLINLQFYKDVVAMERVLRYGFSPFTPSKFWNFGKLVDLNFGSPLGRVLWARQTPRLRRRFATSDYWETPDSFCEYIIQFLKEDSHL